jgi:hypothetical protein
MKIKRPLISFSGIQIKSEECFHKFAFAVQTIEELTGIHSVDIELRDVFFCPWIDIEKCRETHMERLLMGLIEKLK